MKILRSTMIQMNQQYDSKWMIFKIQYDTMDIIYNIIEDLNLTNIFQREWNNMKQRSHSSADMETTSAQRCRSLNVVVHERMFIICLQSHKIGCLIVVWKHLTSEQVFCFFHKKKSTNIKLSEVFCYSSVVSMLCSKSHTTRHTTRHVSG
jgi:hypothetical protein